MKRFLVLLAASILPMIMSGQAQIVTKKVKIEDFTEKTLKVVLTGNPFTDSTLEEDVKTRWQISPFEFCSLSEFDELKSDPDYYFMLTVKGRFRKESVPGIEMLTIVKGGDGADKGIDGMLDVISIPLRAADEPSGREIVFMPALLDIMQEHILASMEKDIDAYAGLSSNDCTELYSSKVKTILIAEDDLSTEITDDIKTKYLSDIATITDIDTADGHMTDGTENIVVSYVVVPAEAKPGSFCYKMLIDAHTHQLYYFKRHRITKKTGAGFLIDDIERITCK